MAARVGYVALMLALIAITVWAVATRERDSSDTAAALRIYVSPDGDDSGPGTEADPFATIQKAADEATPGTTVLVRSGVYRERVVIPSSGDEEHGPIVFAAYPGESPVLDGEGLEVPADRSGMFHLDSHSHLEIRGFDITGFTTDESGHVPIGIYVTGASDHITIEGNRVHDMGTTFAGRNGGDALGIAVYGTDPNHPISDIAIRDNEVDHLRLGSSESLVLNGNVNGFLVEANEVHDNNNIGIDVIGFEGTAPDPVVDQARNGIIRNNLVYNIDSYGNPAYGTDRSANGIYIDGGRDVLIEGNTIHDVNIGMEFASEHRERSTRSVVARNNVVHNSSVIGIAIGGYDRRRGNTEDSVIVNNTFYADEGVELLVQFDTRNNLIANNIFVAGSEASFVENPYEASQNVVDNNVWWKVGGGDEGTWQWNDVTYSDFDSYREGSGNDARSIFADPLLADPDAGDFSLRADSIAIDLGAYVSAGTVDHSGEPRLQHGSFDVGAYEFPAPPPSPTPSPEGSTGYASDLAWQAEENGWGPAERDMSNGERAAGDGLAITIDGLTFEKGIGAHAPSEITIDLDGSCTTFAAMVGIDDETGSQGSVTFVISGDGELLHDTGVVRATDPPLPVTVPITGVEMLSLAVTRGGDGAAFDHADWGDARLDC